MLWPVNGAFVRHNVEKIKFWRRKDLPPKERTRPAYRPGPDEVEGVQANLKPLGSLVFHRLIRHPVIVWNRQTAELRVPAGQAPVWSNSPRPAAWWCTRRTRASPASWRARRASRSKKLSCGASKTSAFIARSFAKVARLAAPMPGQDSG